MSISERLENSPRSLFQGVRSAVSENSEEPTSTGLLDKIRILIHRNCRSVTLNVSVDYSG